MDLWLLGDFIWRTNAGKLGNLALPCLLIQTLGVACLSNFDWDIDKDLNES